MAGCLSAYGLLQPRLLHLLPILRPTKAHYNIATKHLDLHGINVIRAQACICMYDLQAWPVSFTSHSFS